MQDPDTRSATHSALPQCGNACFAASGRQRCLVEEGFRKSQRRTPALDATNSTEQLILGTPYSPRGSTFRVSASGKRVKRLVGSCDNPACHCTNGVVAWPPPKAPIHSSTFSHCWSSRFAEIGIDVPSFWAKSETRYSSSIQQYWTNSGSNRPAVSCWAARSG
jgi:hypothetical protein